MVFKSNTEQIKSLSLTPGGYKSGNTHKILASRHHHKKKCRNCMKSGGLQTNANVCLIPTVYANCVFTRHSWCRSLGCGMYFIARSLCFTPLMKSLKQGFNFSTFLTKRRQQASVFVCKRQETVMHCNNDFLLYPTVYNI